MRAGRRWSIALLALLSFAAAAAQTFEVGLGALLGGSEAAEAWVRFEGVRASGAPATTVTFEVRGPQPGVVLGLSTNQAFGPLGNVIFEARGALATEPAGGAVAEGSLGARGVLGPVALGLALLGFGADPATFDPRAVASSARPLFAGPAAGLQASVTGRFARNTILEAAPEAYLTGDGVALRLGAALRLLRALGDEELRFEMHAYGAPGLGAGAGAVGATVNFPRGREPDVTVGASVGVSPAGLWPGARVALGQRLPGGLRLDLEGAVEPYRLDVPALRLGGALRLPLAGALPSGSELALTGALASDLGVSGGPSGTRLFLGGGLRLPLSLR